MVTLFVVYLILLTKVIVFKYSIGMSLLSRLHEVNVWQQLANGNYIPFKTIVYYLSGNPTWIVAKNNLIGNIAPFIPLGFFASLFYHHLLTWKHILAVAFVISVALESAQVLLRVGVFDIDDIILNVLGVIVGYGVYCGLHQYFARES